MFKQPIPPTPIIASIKELTPLPLIVAMVWKDIKPRMQNLIKGGKSVDEVCRAIVARGNNVAADIMKHSNDPNTSEKMEPEGFKLASYQGASGGFIISMSYLPKKNQTFQVQVKFKMTPGICRRCGCNESDCSGCIDRTGAPCTWVEKDLCSACAHVQLH